MWFFVCSIDRSNNSKDFILKNDEFPSNGITHHHYDCFILRQGTLSDLLYRYSRDSLRYTMGMLIENSSSILRQCEKNQFELVYGLILIQSIFVHYQQISFSLPWTRNFIELIRNLIEYHENKSIQRILIQMSLFNDSPLFNKLFNELEQSLSSKGSIEIDGFHFQVPENANEFNLQWFLSKHPTVNLTLSEFPSKENSRRRQFQIFTQKLNDLWHENSFKLKPKLNVMLINNRIDLLKERLPPTIQCSSTILQDKDLLNIALYQVKYMSHTSLLNSSFDF